MASVSTIGSAMVQGSKRSLEHRGDQLLFYVKALAWAPRAIKRYPREIKNTLAEITFGAGGLSLIGGTVGVIAFLAFFAGTEVGIQGYASLSQIGVAKFSAFISAYFNTREVAPLVSSIALAATVGCGYTARLGAMRISEEIDALEVMGVRPITFLAATRLLAAWMVLPFIYVAAVGVGFFASYLAVVEQIGEVSSGGYFLIFWMFQNPPDLLFSVIKGMAMATAIVAVGCYYGYSASGGPVGVGQATAKSMILNMVLVHLIGMMGSQIFWGVNPRAPIGG
jgi:phospholipid/cholesterol/gamma-HCH transport system permease protein